MNTKYYDQYHCYHMHRSYLYLFHIKINKSIEVIVNLEYQLPLFRFVDLFMFICSCLNCLRNMSMISDTTDFRMGSIFLFQLLVIIEGLLLSWLQLLKRDVAVNKISY